MPNFQNRERWWEYITGSTGSNEQFKVDIQQADGDEDIASSREGSVVEEGASEDPTKQPVVEQNVNAATIISNTTGPERPPHEPTLRRIKQLHMVCSLCHTDS